MIRQIVVIPMLKPGSMSLTNFLDEVMAIGFSAVELWNREDDFEAITESTRARDLRVVSMVGHEHASPTEGSHAEGFSRRNLQRACKWIGHYHTPGVPGRHDLDDSQEINYRAVATAIAATGYDHYVGHEFMPKGDAIVALQQAYDVMDV
jgi:hydroxypyruvate isomerase